MKKILVLFLFFAIYCKIMGGQNIEVSVVSTTAFNGDSVTVSLNTIAFNNVGAVTLKISFNSSALEFGRALNWHSSMNGALAGSNGNTVVLAWDGVNGANIGTGKMVDLKFKYIAGTGSINFVTAGCEIANIEGVVLPVTYFNGSVTQTPVPSAPVLSSPTNNAINQPVNVSLDWNDVGSTNSYNLQISKDINFTNILLNQTNINASNYTVNNLENDQEYFWRVSGTNPTGTGNWSTVWKFKTIVAIPGQVALINPLNGSIDNPTSIEFKWNSLEIAIGYYFQLSSDTLFNTIVISDSLLSDTTKEVTNLEFNKKYFWRVKAKNLAGSGVWSTTWSFSTIYKFNLTGTLKYANALLSPLTNVKINLIRNSIVVDSCYTNNNGYYSFNGIINGSYNIIATTNKIWDGVNSTDALLIRRYSSGYIPFSIIQQKGADVNLSATINSSDALEIRKRIVFLQPSFLAGDWYFENPMININGSNQVVDFSGIVVGDMNGSYTTDLKKGSDSYPTLTNKVINVIKDEVFDYPIQLNHSALLGAITLEVNFSQTDYEYIGVNSTLPNMLANCKDGKVIILWDDINGNSFSENELLTNIIFKKITDKNDSEISISSKSEFADKNGNILNDIILVTPEISNGIPTSFNLTQNYPNPFNPETTIEFSLPVDSKVRLEIFNVLGELVSVLQDNYLSAGNYKVPFMPNGLTSGVYFYRIIANSELNRFTEVKKMIYQK